MHQSMAMANAILRESGINSPKQLYKFMLRECQKLPQGAQEFYRHSIKQSFKQHVFEPDSQRVQQIMQKALENMKWVLQKYNKDTK